MSRELRLIQTEDGSHSLYVPDLNETYHSFHGARQESMHVFIKNGLNNWFLHFPEAGACRVLEVGFGTGLNALLAAQYAQSHGKTIHFTSLEPFPVPMEIVRQLNYAEAADQQLFLKLHEVAWEESQKIHDLFYLNKLGQGLEEVNFPDQSFDVVFFDAFAPNKQAALWTLPMLEKISLSMRSNGILSTYCAQGQFRRDLQSAGLEVSKVPGPPGKKEMTIGVKKP